MPASVNGLIVLVAVALASPAAAQMPSTDIYVADLRVDGRVVEIGTPRNATARPGYDNQPWFLPDGSAFLYNADMGGQTDVFRFDLATWTSTRLTDTPENEFSPSLTRDGREMLVVRWPADMSTGALWRYTPEGDPVAPHAASVDRIGYYGVVRDSAFVVFVNDSVRTFVLVDSRGPRRLRTGIAGSPPQHIPGTNAVSFMMPAEDGRVWIHRAELDSGAVTPIAPAAGESLSYAWLPGNVLLMPSGNAVYALDPWSEAEWREVVRFDDASLASIVRIAVSPTGDRVAFVVEQETQD